MLAAPQMVIIIILLIIIIISQSSALFGIRCKNKNNQLIADLSNELQSFSSPCPKLAAF